MRILKSDEHALMPAPVAVRGKRFWSIGILNYFAFDNPDILLTETEMWKETPSQFGSSPVVLDTGGFKPRGEFLVAGKCWAPRGETRAASQVSVRIGNMCKRLAVFGDRYWKTVSGVTTGITDPLPFSCMPIVWERAFGGAQYAWNAAGKGLVPEKDGAKQRLPLPNIERFDQLMGHPSDRPLPAGFGLIDPSWQPRSGRIGTCDAKWRDTVWPALPIDCDLRFFNWASDDQMLPDFFSGDEHFEILNMHPDYPRLTGRLPAFRQRVLIERMDAQTKDAKAFELPVNIDTVWLFPEIMRGIVIHRAVTEALFEDNRDILALHVVSERRDAPPRPFRELLMSADEHYAAKVNMPRNALFSGMAECDVFAPDYKDRLRMAQASMTRRTVKKAILGQLPRPVMSRPPREEHARLVAALDRQIAESEKLHNELNELIRANAQNSDAELVALEEGLELLRERRAALRDKGKNLPDASFDEVSPPIPRRGPWHDFFFQFVVACRRELEHRPELVKRLMAYGFDEEAIEENWFGYAASSRPCPLGALGLSAASLKELPQGLVVPRFRETELVAVSILPGWPEKPAGLAQAVMAPGSSCAPLHLRATLPGGPVLWVRNDFEALLADFLCGEFYETATLPVPGVSLEPALRDALSRAPSCHMLHVKGLHEAAEAQIQKLHPNLRREILPGGRTLCESAEQGNDVRAALLSFLSAE